MAMLFPATLVVADLLALAGAPPAHGPLDAVRDFGALPDGACPSETMSCTGTDNTPMLQAAIDAAQRQGRPLWLPEGRYMVNSTLTVGCATPATSCPGCTPTGDAGACVEPNATAGAWGLYPLVLTGAGRSLTTIATVHNLHAIMAFNGPPQGGTVGKSTILHDLRDLGFDSGGGNSCPKCPCRYSATCGQANFSIIARSITRSDFTRLSFFNSRIAGMSLAYGWINRVRDSLFSDNHIGLHIWDQCNNVDLTGSNFYGNTLPVIVEDGAQILISGNVIEGSQGPAIIASSIYGLTISSNYFESNNMCTYPACADGLNIYQIGSRGDDRSFNVSVHADIILNGVIDNAGDPSWSFGFENAVRDRQISSEFPCRSVLIEGGYHSVTEETPEGNGSMVLIGAVQGALIRGNDCGGGGQCKNMAVVTTGTDSTLWAARDVSLERNTGWDYTGGSVRLIERGCEYPWDAATRGGVQTQQGVLPWSCDARLDTWADTPARCSGTNIGFGVPDNVHRQRPYTCTAPPPLTFAFANLWSSSGGARDSLPGFSTPVIEAAGTFDGREVHRIHAPAAKGDLVAAAILVAEIPLVSTPSAAGKSLHFTVLARTATTATHRAADEQHTTTAAPQRPSLTLLIDRGDGKWLASNGGALTDWAALGAPAWMSGGWDTHSFSARMGWVGTARMAIAIAAGGAVDVATVKVAQVGM